MAEFAKLQALNENNPPCTELNSDLGDVLNIYKEDFVARGEWTQVKPRVEKALKELFDQTVALYEGPINDVPCGKTEGDYENERNVNWADLIKECQYNPIPPKSKEK